MLRNIIRYSTPSLLAAQLLFGADLRAEGATPAQESQVAESSRSAPEGEEANREPAQKGGKKKSKKSAPKTETKKSSKSSKSSASAPSNSKNNEVNSGAMESSGPTAAEVSALSSPQGSKVEFSAKDVWDVDIFKDPANKVVVLQDRAFTKAGRFELGVNAGVMAANPFYTSIAYGAHAAFHFTEYWGIDAYFEKFANSFSVDGTQIKDYLDNSGFSSRKEFQAPKWYSGVGAIWSPIYGKFAFFRRNIIHFDFFAVFGLSFLAVDSSVKDRGGRDQTAPGSLLGVGMRVFFNKHWSLRFDVKNNIYRSYFAPNNNSGTGEGGNVWRNSFQYTTGVSYMFGS